MTATLNTAPSFPPRAPLDPQTAQRAAAAADLRALLMMVFHYTGDPYWLTERFHPSRDVRLIAPEDAGLPAEVQQEVRTAAVAILSCPDGPAITSPEEVLFLRMMNVAVAEKVPAEYAPMMREQMGLVAPLATLEPLRVPQEVLPVLIVGAGESGIALAAMLGDLEIEYQIVERASEVGGTWRDNVYPGCAVDTPNHSYSYSFGSRYPWSRFFSPRAEIQDYLHRCSIEFRVLEKIRFSTRFVSATWNDAAGSWQVLLDHGGHEERVRCRFLVSAIGPFGEPALPRLEGIDDFAGVAVHSARWPANLDVKGKSVAIIGTGASCMQIAPTIADQVTDLTILQRTPQWVRPIPRFHDRIDEDVQILHQTDRFYAGWYRFIMQWRYGDALLPTLRKDPTWPHPTRSMNKINDRHRDQMTRHIHESLGDRADLIAKCVPNYPPYGKRILLDNGWYDTLLHPHVELRTERIARIERDGLRLLDGTLVRADVIVYATGFDVSLGPARLDIRGRGGRSLRDRWANGAGAYLGISVPEFPNLLLMQGPTTGLAHGGSLILTAEMQARYIATTVLRALKSGVVAMEPRKDLHDRYIARVDQEHRDLVWSHPGMLPYYRNEFGKIRTVLPWRTVDYFHMTRTPNFADYVLDDRNSSDHESANG